MQAPQDPATASAHTLGKYRLIAELGHGGMAEVFLAVAQGPGGFNKLVVIKLIRAQLADDPEFLSMFLDEARLAARLSHPNVVQTNEVGQEAGRYFIAMEYLEGQPLNRLLHRISRNSNGPPSGQAAGRRSTLGPPSRRGITRAGMPLSFHLKIISDALSGLHYAHELTHYDGTPLSVVHRDVTPHNVFITYEGQVKVVDFGIAKALDSSLETRTGVLKGKVAYMAPEQAQGERVDRRADIFSVGILLWEAATGKRLWKGVPDITILQRLVTGDIPLPRSIRPDVPQELEAIIMKALSQERDSRYPTALDLQDAIEGFLDVMRERVTSRDISELIMATFEADRARIKTIIEGQLRAPAVSVPPTLSLTETATSLPIADPTTAPISTPLPSSVAPPSNRRASKGSRRRSSSSHSASVNPPSPSTTGHSMLFTSASVSQEDRASQLPRRGNLALAVVLGVAALGGMGLWLYTRNPPFGSSGVEPTASASAVLPVIPQTVEINIAAMPAEAKIYLDDKLFPNPFRGKLPIDAGHHKLRMEAPGFVTQSRVVSLNRPVDIELVLQKDEKATEKIEGPRPAPAVQPSLLPPRQEDPRPPPEKPKRGGDTNDPYQ